MRTLSLLALLSLPPLLAACEDNPPPGPADLAPPPRGCDRAYDGGPCLPRDGGADLACPDRCGIDCVDRQTDFRNCGSCGHACSLGEQCVAGRCVALGCPDCRCQGTLGLGGLPLSSWGPQAVALAAGDFNADGILDLAAADWYDAGLLLGNKDGTFRAGPTVGPDPGPVAVVTGDFNGDKKLDIAVAAAAANAVNVFTGDGQGRLSGQSVDLATERTPSALAAADFDGDGRLDLAAAATSSDVVSVLLARPPMGTTAVFAPQATFATGDGPVAIAAADLDGDGKIDLVTANANAGDVTVLRGAGDGTFAAPVASPAGRRPVSLAVADLDGDGKPDVAVANPDDRTISVLRNTGGGKFAAPAAFPFSAGADRVAAADLDGDGRPDLVVAASSAARAGVLRNTTTAPGSPSFAAATSYVTAPNPSSIVLGDFNRDKQMDIALGNPGQGAVTVLLGQGQSTFAAATSAPAPDLTTTGAAAADLDGDGHPDLVLAQRGGLAVLLARGATWAAATYAAGARPTTIALADFDGDGKTDVATANADPMAQSGTVSLLFNRGSAGALGPAQPLAACKRPTAVTAADIDGDGRPDLAAACPDDRTVLAWRNQGAGAFTAWKPVTACAGATALAAADLDGDGHADLAVACADDQGTALLAGHGDGTFAAPRLVYTVTRPVEVTIADFDGDGHPDLLTRTAASVPALNLTRGLGQGAFALPISVGDDPGPYAAAVTADFDGDGHPDVAAVPTNRPALVVLHLYRPAVAQFIPGGTFPTGYRDASQLAAADFDGDGATDLAAANTGTAAVVTLPARCFP